MGAVPPNPSKVVPCRAVFLLCQGARRDKGFRRSLRRLDLFSSPPVRSSPSAKPPLRYASPLRSPSLGALLNKRKAPCQSILLCFCCAARLGSGSVVASFFVGWCSLCCFSGFLLLFFGRLGRCFSLGCSSAVGSALLSRRSAVGLALSPSRFCRLCLACGGRFSPGSVGSCSFGFLVRRLSCRRVALGSFRCRRRRRSSLCAVGGRRGGSACLPRLFPAGCGWSAPVPSFLPSSVVAPVFCCSRGSVFRAFVAAAAGFRCFRRLSAARQRSKPYERRYKNDKQKLL